MPLCGRADVRALAGWRRQPSGGRLRRMSMTFSTARPTVVCLVLCLALVGCGGRDDSELAAETSSLAEPASAQQSERADALDALASAASQQATEMSTLLLVMNRTADVVLLTSADGQYTARVDPGKSLRLASQRVCDWLPLTASASDGGVIEEYTQPCHGQTWTITAPSPRNAVVVERAMRLLERSGVTGVRDDDQGHDEIPNAMLTGEWEGHQVLAYAIPEAVAPPLELEVLRTSTVAGVQVQHLALKDTTRELLRFQVQADLWSLAVLSTDGISSDPRLSRSLVESLLAVANDG